MFVLRMQMRCVCEGRNISGSRTSMRTVVVRLGWIVWNTRAVERAR